MFNIKFPIKLIIFLLITILINIFSTVTLKYNAISLNEFRSYEIICGDIFEVVQATSNSDYSERLGANWRQCKERGLTILVTSSITFIFLITLLIYLFYIYKNRPKREELSDLLTILKRMNKK